MNEIIRNQVACLKDYRFYKPERLNAIASKYFQPVPLLQALRRYEDELMELDREYYNKTADNLPGYEEIKV